MMMQFNKKEKMNLLLAIVVTLATVSCAEKISDPIILQPQIQADTSLFVPCQRQLSEFEDTGLTFSGTGSGTMSIYKDKNSPIHRYLIKNNRWLEAYASTIYRFFLGESAQEVCFIEDGSQIHAAVKLEDSFAEAWSYFQPGFDITTSLPNLKQPLLPVGHGLGGIIVTSMCSRPQLNRTT